MKLILTFALIALTNMTFGQTNIPHFLQGTWKIENSESYEHWDQLNDQTLKGFSYKIENRQMLVSEYLEITQKDNDVVYTATVINQNQGKGIDFKLTRADSVFLFEKPRSQFSERNQLSETFENRSIYKGFGRKGKMVFVQDDKTGKPRTGKRHHHFQSQLRQRIG